MFNLDRPVYDVIYSSTITIIIARYVWDIATPKIEKGSIMRTEMKSSF